MKVGYARVSTSSQSLDSQLKALKEAGCEKVYHEKISGAKTHRKEFEAMMDFVRDGDQVVVTRLDRLSRSSHELQITAQKLEKEKVDLRVLEQNIDTSSPLGKLMFHMIAAIAEFERSIINERAESGRKAAIERGVKFGPQLKLSDDDVVSIMNLMSMGESVTNLANTYGVGRATIYRAIERIKREDS